MKLWIVNVGGTRTYWSARGPAEIQLRKAMLESQEEALESCIDDLKNQRAWAKYLAFETDVVPDVSIWEMRDASPEKLAWPQWRVEALEGLRSRIAQEEGRAKEFKRRIRNIKAGKDYSGEWGMTISDVTVDDGAEYE